MPTFENLRALRERLGYRFHGVVRLTCITPDRLQAIESGTTAPTVYETEELARIYGVDADVLADEPIKVPSSDVIQALASLDEFRMVGDTVRARIIAAAQASRDLIWLRKQLREQAGVERFAEERPVMRTARESPPDFAAFPLQEVPYERRTTIARLAAQAYSCGIVSRTRFAELLGLTRAYPVERVLDMFGLDPPAEDAA